MKWPWRRGRSVLAAGRRRVPRNRRKPNIPVLLSIFAACVFVSGAVAYALRTPSLQVKEVDIAGVGICDRATVESIGRAALGQNILILRKSPIERRIRSLSQVERVKMGRSFPNRVWIRIWERRPDAVLTDGRRWWLMQDDGLVFHSAAGPPKGVPVLRVEDCGPVKVGRICESTRVRYALQVLRCGRDEGLKLGKISVDPQGDMCLNMGSDFYVRLGQPNEIALKISLLRSALVYKPSIAKEALYIDVSCPAAPVWRPKRAAQDAS